MDKAIHCPECGCEIGGDYMSADPARRYFFAALRETHGNLRPEHLERWPNAEALRKHALIAVGHCDVMTVACGSKTAAPMVAAAFRTKDRYCVATVNRDVVMICTARSMARRVLLKKDFLEVSQQVFNWIYQETGIDAAEAGRSAA